MDADEREVIIADILQLLYNRRVVRHAPFGGTAQPQELYDSFPTWDNDVILELIEEMDENDDIPLKFSSSSEITLTDGQKALEIAQDIYMDIYS